MEKDTYVQTIPCEDDETYKSMIENLQEKGISNLRECLFRITPEVLMDFHKEYKKLLSVYEKTKLLISKKNMNFEHSE